MEKSTLTIGDVLPSKMKSNYSGAVLAVKVKEALDIAKLGEPPSSDLSSEDVSAIKDIYSLYLSADGEDSDSAYWSQSTAKNDAYWSQ
ncbi:MAG: hypothetical protein KJP21_06475 [Bacteroidia bacterium]|nr:hypothetical protein [Bacteroidia bacterium]NNJ55176.1 hypothetical protein [Bacteroidia bacterium]